MKDQPNRLELDARHAFAGHAIDRSRPLRFRLNGHPVEGFAGDTVLSAALACGLDTLGTHEGHPVALSLRSAPPVAPAGEPDRALPMERLHALDGLDLITVPAGSSGHSALARAGRLLRGTPRSLGIKLDAAVALPASGQDAAETRAVDVLVVGGGVAGMEAGVAAARMGFSVALIERRPMLGGDALLFGRTEGEEPPEDAIARLKREIVALPDIAVHVASEAISVEGNRARVHGIVMDGERPTGIVTVFEARHVILATGSVERLPLFAGNRLPGIVGTAEAFHLAHAYGMWPGRSAAVATVSNPAYRLAMLAADAGIAVRRILDRRPAPQSRFLEFCKAYGITMAGGMVPLAATPAPGGSLSVSTAVSIDGYERQEEPLVVDRLAVCGGWQPELTLWHMGGGRSRWHAGRLIAAEGPQHLVLAGAAAGHLGTQACLDSGRDALARITGEPRVTVRETVIDPAYETPDARVPVARAAEGSSPLCYLDAGASLAARPQVPAPGLFERLRPARRSRPFRLAEQPRAFGIADVAAGVDLEAIPAASAGDVARERALGAGQEFAPAEPGPAAQEPPPPHLIPGYFAGRYGPHASVWLVQSVEHRRLETGSLIFVNSDQANPAYAIGVVLSPLPGERGSAWALIGKIGATPGEGATLRDQNRPVPIRLVRPHDGVFEPAETSEA